MLGLFFVFRSGSRSGLSRLVAVMFLCTNVVPNLVSSFAALPALGFLFLLLDILLVLLPLGRR